MDPHSQNELLTNAMNGQVYETLVSRDKQLALEPALATEWKQLGPLQWRFKLRPNVKFHDGAPLTADDVVFSVQRAREGTSDIKAYANALGEPKKIDALTVEFKLKDPNPIFLQHLATIQIMNKAWCEKNKATKPQDFKNKEEAYTAFNANGTGPYMPGVARAGCEDRLQAQPGLVGQVRRQCAGRGLHPDQERRHPRRRADLRRGRLRPRSGPAGRAPPAQHRRREGHRRPGKPHHLHRHGPGA